MIARMAALFVHGNGWAIVLGLVANLLLYLVLPVLAIVLALKYLRRPKTARREGGKEHR